MRFLSVGAVLLALGSAAVGQAPPQKPTPVKPVEVKLPAGITKVVTVEGITEYKLKNGLRLLLLQDPSQPKVTVNNTIFVGSRHEGYGETGMAHLLEHMVFKGTPKFNDVPKAIRDHGAITFNGTTWLDRTNYYCTFPSNDDNLEFGIELEADRMMNSFVKREDLVSEFTVVRNEFESGENSPERILSQRMVATAFEWHNYGKSTIGNKTDIERVPIDNLKAFYKKYYRPDNAMLIVAGSFDPNKALSLVDKHFGGLKNPEEPLPKTYTEEPAQDGERLVTLRRVGKVGATGVVYHIPAAAHPDFPAVEVLESALTDAPSGRVYKALVETKKASAISGNAFGLHDPGMLEIGATTEPKNTEDARDTLVNTLEKLADHPITKEEVDRAKQALLKGRERALTNSQRFAIELSDWASSGDWRLFFIHRDRLEKVTVDDVNRVAKAYLLRANRTVGIYIPTEKSERADVPPAPAIATLVDDYKGRDAVAQGEAFDPTPENIEQRVKRGTVGQGMQYAALSKKTRGEMVTMTMNIRTGNAESLAGKNVAFDFVGDLMMRGTKSRTRQQINDELNRLGATLSVSTDGDAKIGIVEVGLTAKKKDFPAALAILGEILREPSFPEKEFEVIKRTAIDELEKGKAEPILLARNALMRKMMPYEKTDVRYMPTLDEAAERLKAAKLDDVKKLYAEQLASAAGEVAIVGDFDVDATVKQLDGILKGWTSAVPYKRIEKPYKPTAGSTETINTPDKANALFLAGMTTEVSDTDPNYAALAIGNFLLGEAPLSSRISNRIRGKDGLSYGAGSNIGASSVEKSGVMILFAITNPKNLDKVDAAMGEEVGKFLKEGVSASELEDAKKAWIAAKKGDRTNDRALAGQLSGALFAKRDMRYYDDLEKKMEQVQPGDVKAAFDKLVDQKRLVIIKAGDVKKGEEENKKDEKKKEEKKSDK